MTKDDFEALLEPQFAQWNEVCGESSRLVFLSDEIFGFTTYDNEMSALFAAKALEVCAAIADRANFEYIKDPDNYRWYLLMCNMPFFAKRLEWGTSIRGAWWRFEQSEFRLGLVTLKVWHDDWPQFIAALREFAKPVESGA